MISFDNWSKKVLTEEIEDNDYVDTSYKEESAGWLINCQSVATLWDKIVATARRQIGIIMIGTRLQLLDCARITSRVLFSSCSHPALKTALLLSVKRKRNLPSMPCTHNDTHTQTKTISDKKEKMIKNLLPNSSPGKVDNLLVHSLCN